MSRNCSNSSTATAATAERECTGSTACGTTEEGNEECSGDSDAHDLLSQWLDLWFMVMYEKKQSILDFEM